MTTDSLLPAMTTGQRLIRSAAEHGTRFGDRKVFLSTIPGVDLRDSACRALLQSLQRSGAVSFARADMVAAMPAELVAASEWVVDSHCTLHFLVLPDALASWDVPVARRAVR